MQENTSRMQKFPEDSIILREGELRDDMYKIVSGKAAVYLNYGKENEYLLGILGEQQCFGELGLLCRQPSMYTVVAVYDVLIMRINLDEFGDFLKNNNKNAIDIIRNLSWCMVNLKGNLDLVLEELTNMNGADGQQVSTIREKIQQHTMENIQQYKLENEQHADSSDEKE